MAFTKEEKGDILASYENWLGKSQAIFIIEYKKMTQKDLDNLRAKVREAGGEFHMVKNTLMNQALQHAGMSDSGFFDGQIIVGFAFNDPPAMAKVFSDATRNSEIFRVRGGYLGTQPMQPAAVKSLADLPPLPVMRARLLGVLQAPAAQLVRTVAEPARSLASVFRAYSEKDQQAADTAA